MVFQTLLISPLAQKMMLFGIVNVHKGVSNSINAVLAENASLFIEKSKSNSVVQNVTYKENIEAPIEKGEILGEATYSIDDNIIKKINIVAGDTVPRLNLINMTTNIYTNWFKLLR